MARRSAHRDSLRRAASEDRRHEQPVARSAVRASRPASPADRRRGRFRRGLDAPRRPCASSRRVESRSPWKPRVHDARVRRGGRAEACFGLLWPRQSLWPPRPGDARDASRVRCACPSHGFPLGRTRGPAGRTHPLDVERAALRLVASPPLLIVLGPTGSGKSDLAHRVALLRGGEVVSADAFAVYRGMDVGTAKPSAEQQREVLYHLIDVASPADFFSAGRWAREAREIVDDIHRRGRLPIVCGGSGFYLEALLEGLPPGGSVGAGLRSALTAWAKDRPQAAHRFLEVNDPVSARRIPPANLRYTLRALEILLETGTRASDRARTGAGWTARWRLIKIGLRPSGDQLYATIARRVRQMLNAGWDL